MLWGGEGVACWEGTDEDYGSHPFTHHCSGEVFLCVKITIPTSLVVQLLFHFINEEN